MLLSKKDEEISKLKEIITSIKSPLKQGKNRLSDSNIPFMSNTLIDRFGSFSSAASLGADEKYVIAQLKQEICNLKNVIALQSQAEQGLNKRLQYLESSRSKGEINYEYIKNIFLKYLLFKDTNEEDAKKLCDILLDLLKVNKQEKEILEKARNSKGFWKLFKKNEVKAEILMNLSSSYLVKPYPRPLLATIGNKSDSKIEEEAEE